MPIINDFSLLISRITILIYMLLDSDQTPWSSSIYLTSRNTDYYTDHHDGRQTISLRYLNSGGINLSGISIPFSL